MPHSRHFRKKIGLVIQSPSYCEIWHISNISQNCLKNKVYTDCLIQHHPVSLTDWIRTAVKSNSNHQIITQAAIQSYISHIVM